MDERRCPARAAQDVKKVTRIRKLGFIPLLILSGFRPRARHSRHAHTDTPRRPGPRGPRGACGVCLRGEETRPQTDGRRGGHAARNTTRPAARRKRTRDSGAHARKRAAHRAAALSVAASACVALSLVRGARPRGPALRPARAGTVTSTPAHGLQDARTGRAHVACRTAAAPRLRIRTAPGRRALSAPRAASAGPRA